MGRTTLVLLCFGVSAMLASCATMPSNDWVPSLQQIKAAGALKTGIATVADVEAAYGVPCVPSSEMSVSTHCLIDQVPTQPPETLLMYNIVSDWSPSCWSDPDGCETVTQSTMLQISYVFDSNGLLKSVSSSSSCTAYVGEYRFDNGCLDHD